LLVIEHGSFALEGTTAAMLISDSNAHGCCHREKPGQKGQSGQELPSLVSTQRCNGCMAMAMAMVSD